MHSLFTTLNLLKNRLSEFILLFSQILSLQLLFYPIIFLGFLFNLRRLIKSKLTIVITLFVLTIAASLYLRGASTEILLRSLQYYLGILLVVLYFKTNKNTSIQPWLIYSFIGLVFYEVISTNIFSELVFFYDDPKDAIDNLAINQIGFTRAQTSSGFYRAFGPALNASISGSMLAILFFILFDQRKSGVSIILITLVFAAFIFSGSNTAVAVFLAMIVMSLLKKIMQSPALFFPIFFVKSIGWGLIFIVLGYFLYLFFQIYFDLEPLTSPFAKESIIYVIGDKKYMFTHVVEQSENILFGRDLSSIDQNMQIGGDSVIFNVVQNIGLYGLLGLFSILMWSCEKGKRIYVVGGFIASLHYGALFTLSGQFFFGAIAANAILRKN